MKFKEETCRWPWWFWGGASTLSCRHRGSSCRCSRGRSGRSCHTDYISRASGGRSCIRCSKRSCRFWSETGLIEILISNSIECAVFLWDEVGHVLLGCKEYGNHQHHFHNRFPSFLLLSSPS